MESSMYDQTSLPLQIEPTPKPLPMAWNSLPGKMPPAGREVLVQIDGHRGPAWGNRYALVAYCDQEGNWWEERHPSTEPLAGVIGWAYFDGPQPPTKAAPVKKSPKTDKEPMLIEGKDLVKGVTYYLTGMWWPDGGKPVKLKKWVRACELMKGAGGKAAIVKGEDGEEYGIMPRESLFIQDPSATIPKPPV
jgi:hypothetical protein